MNITSYLLKSYLTARIIFFLLIILSSSAAMCQAEKIALPKGRFLVEDVHTSDMYKFSRNKLTVKTYPFLHYGAQYTHIYTIDFLDDSTFILTPQKKYSKYKGVRSQDQTFTLSADTYTRWRVTKINNDKYLLYGFRPIYESIKQREIQLKLIRTKVRYKQNRR